MTFLSTSDAQTYVVQQVINKKSLELAYNSATTTTEKNIIKANIRNTQTNINLANTYLVENRILGLIYSSAIFTQDDLIMTPWSNEKDIPQTLQNSVHSQPAQSQTDLLLANANIITEINALIVATEEQIVQDKQSIRELQTSKNSETALSNTKKSLQQLLINLKALTDQKAQVEGVGTEIENVTVPASTYTGFDASIRTQIQKNLELKPGYVASENDVNAVLNMRRLALDSLYTANTDTEKKTALDRVQKTAEAMSPVVPVTRKTLTEEELLLTTIVLDISNLNTQIEPIIQTLDTAWQIYKAADEISDPLAPQYKATFDALVIQRDAILVQINKKYETLLNYQDSFGSTGMNVGSLNSTTPPTPPNPLPDKTIFYDTKAQTFVTREQAQGDPGRYLSSQYVDRPVSQATSEQEKIQSTISVKYYEATKAEADYNFQKTVEPLRYQNANRNEIIQEDSKELAAMKDKYYAKRDSMSDSDKLATLAAIQGQEQKIKDNAKIISDNSAKITDATKKYEADVIPFSAWDKKQAEVSDKAGSSVATAIATPNALEQQQKITTDFYDSRKETQLAQRQSDIATNITSEAEKKITSEAIARGKTPEEISAALKNGDPDKILDPALKTDYDNKKALSDTASGNLGAAQLVESINAANAQKEIDKITNNPNLTESQKEAAISQLGLNPADVRAVNQSYVGQDSVEKRTQDLQASADQKLAINESKYNTLVDKNQAILDSVGGDESKLTKAQKDELAANNAKISALNDEREKLLATDWSAVATKQLNQEKTYANEVKPSNTGFEGINNSAPFYMQFPTLNSIAAFRIKNGFDPYGEKDPDAIARDAINFKIFETIPGVNKASVTKDGNYITDQREKNSINTLGSFTIYPSHSDGKGNWLTQSHNHTYAPGTEGAIASMAQTGLSFIDSSESIMKMVNLGFDAANRGSLKGATSPGNSYNRKIDVLDIYQDSEKQDMRIDFSLFTKDNFLNDVFRPLMFLTGLSYPKRALHGDLGDLTSDTIKKLTDTLNNTKDTNAFSKYILDAMSKLNMTPDDMKKGGKDLGDLITDLETKLGEEGGLGPYRYYISKRPEFLSVRHVSGLFQFPLAYITNITYNFKGPWYNVDGQQIPDSKDLDALISQKIKSVEQPPPAKTFKENMHDIGTKIGDVFRSPPPKVPKPPAPPEPRPSGVPGGLLAQSEEQYTYIKSKGLPFAYPSWAECSITVKNATKQFRDDYMALYYASEGGPNDLVSITKKMTNQEAFAFGGRKSVDNQVDTGSFAKNRGK